jgi:hypothetical protein
VLALSLCLASPPLRAECDHFFSNLGTRALDFGKATVIGVVKTGLFTIKTLEYPFWFLGHAGVLGYQAVRSDRPGHTLSRIPIKIIKRDGISFILYAIIYTIGRSTIFTLYEMDRASHDGKESPDDLVVYVNGFDGTPGNDDEAFHDATEDYLSFRHGGNKRAVQIRANNLEELKKELQEVSAKHGKVARLEFFGHGMKGAFFLSHEPYGESHFSGTEPKLEGVFAPGAKIVLNTCWITRGNGEETLKALGENFLDEGGSVYAQEVTFAGSPSIVSDLAAMPYLAYRGGKDALDYSETKPLVDYLTKDRLKVVPIGKRPAAAPAAPKTY